MNIKSITVAAAALVLSTAANAVTYVEDFSGDPFSSWESGWLGLNSNIQNYYGIGSENGPAGPGGPGDRALWITDGDSEPRNGETVDIIFENTFGLSLTSFSIDMDTYVDTSIQVYDGSGGILLDVAADQNAGYQNFSVASANGISGFSLFSSNQIEGNTAIDNVIVTAVPVPAAVWLFGSGLLGLFGVAGRRS